MQAVILAGGESSRFWPINSTHKSLLKIMGKPLIWYTIESLKKAGITEAIVIQGPKKEVEKELDNYDLGVDIKYLVQPQPKGMGNAVMLSEKLINGSFFVFHAHKVNAGEYVKLLQNKANQSKVNLILLGAKTDSPWLYGMVKLNGDKVKKLVEKPKKGSEPSDIMILGTYLLPREFFSYYRKVSEHQYAFEDALGLYMGKNDVRIAIVSEEFSTFKFPWHFFEIEKSLFDNFLEKKIDSSATIGKNVVIDGKVFVGKNAKILDGVVIKGPCYIGENVVVGTNSLIRDYVDLEKDDNVGALTEVARSIFQEGVHVHSGYFGDSVLGKNCKIGAGCITANVKIDRSEVFAVVKGEKRGTGRTSLGCFIGEGSGVGANSSFMPGVFIGKNSVIGPNSLVSENIENGMLYYDKFEKVIKKKD